MLHLSSLDPRGLLARMLVLPLAAAAAQTQFAEPDVRVIHTFAGEAPGDSFGWAVSGLADVDGDGVNELICPAPGNDGNGSGSGRIYVYSGGTGQPIPGLDFTGEVAGSRLGYSIADAGDVNGDGIHDVVGGAPGPNAQPGSVEIYSGSDGSLIRTVHGEEGGDAFGAAVGGLGDVDGDGLAEVLVGAPGHFGGAGRAYVLSGKDGSVISSFDGQAPGDGLGSGIAGTGDLDGDLVGDWIVGAPGAGAGGHGLAYVISGLTNLPMFSPLEPDPTGASYGQFFVAGCGDANADGTPDLYVGDYADSQGYVYSGLDGARLLTLVFPSGFGCGRGAGDVDGDGHADLAIGAYQGKGRVYILSGADGSVLRTISSTTSNENFGFDAVGVDDLDGDGLADILVGAAGAGGNRVYAIAGNAVPCAADCDQNGSLDLFDFLCFVNLFNVSDPSADCDDNGLHDLFDFLCFTNSFNAGC